jgi:hypothetical protein
MITANFTAIEACDGLSIKFTDTTGIYSAGSNEGGWGVPNEE